MNAEAVQRYLAETRAIEGWFFPIDALLFGALDEMQARESIGGNLFEIGVHHGKSAILLARMCRGGEVLGVCDVFGAQELNVDHSGEGSRELFLRNVAAHARLGPSQLRVFAKRSSELTAEETSTNCRFFHIDGGHRPADVVNDLGVAVRALGPDGIAIVDDVFNPSWPGVSEGVYAFAAQQPDALVPIVIGGNKAFFMRPAAVPRYRRQLDDLAAGAFFADEAFRFETKEGLGRAVLVASRRDWVDLHPLQAAALHARRGTAEASLLRWLVRWFG
jgi:SAM-dependent methyltransferase